MLNMRSVSLVQHVELEVNGRINPNCMVFADFDGDGFNEFACCNSSGETLIFKGKSSKPLYKFVEKCDVSCLAAGDIYNNGRNCLLIISISGEMFTVELEKSNGKLSHTVKKYRILENASHVLLDDINKNGKLELLVSHSDCYVSAYRWNEKKCKLQTLQIWRLQYFAGNIAIHCGENEQAKLMVSQPGCSYAVLRINKKDWESSVKDIDEDMDFISHYNVCGPEFIEFTPLSSRTRSNPTVTCQIIGDIKKSGKVDRNGKKEPGYFALCTLDGTIKLMEECTILWSVQVDHQLFAMAKLDVLGDSREEVIVCAWDGQTYILDHDRNVVRYHFHKNVQSFCAGKFSYDGAENFPSLAYADFTGKIYLYYDVRLPFLTASDLTTEAENCQEITEIFRKLRVTDEKGKKEILKYVLYEMPILDSLKKEQSEIE